MASASTTSAIPFFLEADTARSRTGAVWFSAARFLLVVTLLLAPLAFGAVQVWAWASLSFVALLALVLWAAGSVQQGALRILWSPIYLPAALFVLLGLMQLFGPLTADPVATRESLLKLATDLIFFFLAGQLVATGSERTMRRLGLAITVFAFALSLFAILQFFSSHGLIYWVIQPQFGGWVFGPYVNRNHYAGLMEMLIPVGAAYVFSRPENNPTRAMLVFAVLVPIASLLLSGSRGGFVSLLAEILILGAILFRRYPARGRHRLATTGAMGIAAAVLLFFWMDPGDVSKRLATVADAARSPEVTFGERKVVTLDSLRIFRDHPWVGAGLGTFETAYPRYRSFPSDLLWDHAHNDYAEALAETGLAGGMLILAALVLFFRLAFRNLGERLKHEAGWIQLGAALGCCGLLVHSFVDFNLHIPANAAWFALLAAVSVQGPCRNCACTDCAPPEGR